MSTDEVWHVSSKTTVNDKAGSSEDRVEQVIVLEACSKGCKLLTVTKTSASVVAVPQWDTLQVGMQEHVRFSNKALKLNHSKRPNSYIHILDGTVELHALQDIAVGEPLSFNYNTTEYEMSDSFMDWASGEQVGGFKKALQEERDLLLRLDLVAPHVLELWKRDQAK